MSRRAAAVLLIVVAAALLRGWAVVRLPVDFDEPVYYRAAQALAAAVRAGDPAALAAADTAAEHPALVKLLYAAVLAGRPAAGEAGLGEPLAPLAGAGGRALRWASAAFGVLHVLLLAVASPAAGALLAVHSYAVKYTAQIYLEALPMFTATVCVLAYRRARRPDRSRRGGPALLALSAVALGLTAAGKYIYAVAGLAVAADALWTLWAGRRPRDLLPLLAWGALALLTFYIANPNLWPDPAGRLAASLAFHTAYAGGEHVAGSGYPPWQPLVWLLTPQPARWHPGIIVTPLDTLTAALGVLGAPPLWRRAGGRVIVLWWLFGLAFALLWPTKWPQYSLVMTAPMCLCAAEGIGRVWRGAAAGGPPAAG